MLLLTACSVQTPGQSGGPLSAEQIKSTADKFREEGNEWLAGLLEDGEVDAADYAAASERYASCMRGLGYEVPAPMVNPTNSMTHIYDIDMGTREPDAFGEDDLSCKDPDLNVIEAAYLNTGVQRMDESLRIAAQECMAELDYEIPDDARDIRAFSGDPTADEGAQREAAATCISDEALRLFPELPYVGVAY
ncbi:MULTISPECIES: hypothetical protein [unclassified Microbacterium]|uniref:hypothetical protein n=1 Tax=unclassified Microbacterium TaxID=2609290 RepID=UPI00109C4AB0|nr:MULTISPECIES: hypothetical protein [unclassified Microbacterium]